MIEIATGIRTLLTNSANVTNLLSDGSDGVYMDKAAPGSDRPCVIFFKGSGIKDWQFGDGLIQRDTWTVKGVGFFSQASAIDSACQAVLTKADLGIAGMPTLMMMPISDVYYSEFVEGEDVRHVGAIYRVKIQKG